MFELAVVQIINDVLNKGTPSPPEFSAHSWGAFLNDPLILKGIKEFGLRSPFVQQERIMNSVLGNNDNNVTFELPHACGKTTALLILLMSFIRQDNDDVQVIYFTPDAHCALQVYEMATTLAKFTRIKISLVMRGHSLRSCQIIIGTPLEICSQVKEVNTNMGRLNYICGDDADKTLPYKIVWELIERVPFKPTVIAASTSIKLDLKKKIGANSLTIRRDQLLRSNVSSVNILCANLEAKFSKLNMILAELKKKNLQTLITVNVSSHL